LNANYWQNGLLYQMTSLAPYPSLTQTPDGEGRPSAISDTSGNQLVTSTVYNTFGEPTTINFGGSGFHDTYGYDGNTGRMNSFQFPASGGTYSGTPTWNANGTLASLIITDPFPATSDSQTCAYSYDDFARLSKADCGAVWLQTFTYPQTNGKVDPFGNINKDGNPGISFKPTYDTTTNRYLSLPSFTPTYDGNGNLLTDSFHTYTWNAEGKLVGLDNAVMNYDALGRLVEIVPHSGAPSQTVGPARLASRDGLGTDASPMVRPIAGTEFGVL
jgi:hypothetical protein